MTERPGVLVFDVNETLLDIESLTPHFERVFGDPAVLREWFGQLVLYSMTATLSRRYVDLFTLGAGVLGMLADVHGVPLTAADRAGLTAAMAAMPAHPDVTDGLTALRDNGFRLVTLTNSPLSPDGRSPLDRAGLGEYFERQFSVDTCRTYKPDPAVYLFVCRGLGIEPAEAMMVAAHVWDTVGAQSAGMQGALITRPGNAELPVDGLPQPNLVAADVRRLAWRLGAA